MNQLVQCGRHGQGPGYCVCLHILDGAKAAHVVKATEQELGEATCAECMQKTLTVDDLALLCAGCFAESQRGREGRKDMRKLKAGDRVKVTDTNHDETILNVGRIGEFTGKTNPAKDVGGSASDPLHEVKFRDGSTDHFWREELEKL